jgi:iron complex outermembrane receptor protein
LSGRIIAPIFGSIYSTPGSTNAGLPGWTESSFPGHLIGADGDGDGVTDISFRDYDLNGKDQGSDLFPEYSRTSVMAYGEYTFEGEMNLTPYFEGSYNQRDYLADTREAQFFPNVPGSNPFNPCNPAGIRGVDCGLAWDAFVTNPNIVSDFQDVNEALCAQFGFTRDECIPALFGQGPVGPIGPQPARVVATVDGDRSVQWADVEQYRFVLGARGDLPNFSAGSSENWTFDVSLTTAQSNGQSAFLGIRDDFMNLSAQTTIEDPNNPGTFICGVDDDGDGIPDGTDGCVPVDFFNPSLYPPGTVIGEFATQEERDYLFDSRDFNTKYYQDIWSAYVTGDLFQMPSGPVSVVFGFEYRQDEIKSIPDEVARDGLFTAFFADGGATGQKFTREYYAEIELPLLANVTAAEELSMNLSARHTTDQLYGSDTTYSAKLGWLPVQSLLLRATYGTSFRAPNLRENFLVDQTGFGTISDPCVTPDEAFDDLTGVYNPALDNRDPAVLQNCFDNGVDPTDFGLGFSSYSVEIATAGVTDITAETSESWSIGFSFDQPWSDSFRLNIGATYYEIDIEDAIIEPNPQFIVSDCYTIETFDSVFCDRITRDSDMLLDFIDAGFINRDNATVRGYDINVAFDMDVTMFSRAVTLGADLMVNRGLENSDLFVSIDGTPSFDDDQGQWGLPDWRGQLDFRADVGDLRFTWRTNYLGEVDEDPDTVDDFDDVIGPPGLSDTCLGPTQGDVQCRDIAFADDYWLHSTSLYYYGDVWTFGAGVRNVFDEEPKIADQAKNFVAFNSVSGVVVGRGYDLQGRTYFLNVAANFGGGL